MTAIGDRLGQAHTQAFLDLLADADDVLVFDGAPPRGTTGKYAAVYPDPGTSSSDRLSSQAGAFTQVIQVTGVGANRWQAQWVLDQVAGVVDRARPSIPGRNVRPIEQILARPIEADNDDPEQPTCFGVVQYRISSTPAPLT